MTNQEIEQKLKEILSKQLNIELSKVNPSARLAEDLGVDSFKAVELMFEIEEAFGMKIKDSDFERVRSVNDIIVFIRNWLDQHPTT
jgi:acyl carrier protein